MMTEFHCGKRFAELMEEAKLISREVSRRTGLQEAKISRLKNSETWGTDDLLLICNFFNITIAKFFYNEEILDQLISERGRISPEMLALGQAVDALPLSKRKILIRRFINELQLAQLEHEELHGKK